MEGPPLAATLVDFTLKLPADFIRDDDDDYVEGPIAGPSNILR